MPTLDEITEYAVKLWNKSNPFGAVYDPATRTIRHEGQVCPVEEFYNSRILDGWDAGCRSRESYWALVLKSNDLHYKSRKEDDL